MTRMDRTTGVSRLPTRPRSRSSLAITPEDDTQVIPAMATAAIGPQPRTSANAAPGTALNRASSIPALRERLRLPTSSSAEYSRPSMARSRMTPISAPTSKKSLLADISSAPPVPRTSPASRYSGIGEMPKRMESRPSRLRPRSIPPTSTSITVVSFIGSASVQPVLEAMRSASESKPCRVPTATSESPASSRSCGVGDAITCLSRTMATMDAPVLLRALVAPSGRPA